MRRSTKVVGPFAVMLLFAGVSAVPASARDNRDNQAARTETAVRSASPVTAVAESMVRVRVPLPSSAGPRPAACDWLSYLRWRSVDGPQRSAEADKILIAQPGVLEGASAFDGVARNTIVEAARRGKHVEFWALDRRSNCLDDNTGLLTGDLRTAIDYYYGGKAVGGKTFAGFFTNDQVGFLANVGLEQTVRDQFDLMVAELPDPSLRKEKVLCGGHSLGGILTGFFSIWDFDGNHDTLDDAGFNQCAGYFALDTTISTAAPNVDDMMPDGVMPDPRLSFTVVKAGLDSGILPRALSAPALINAETMSVLGLAGLAAASDPDGESELADLLPATFNIDATLRLLMSKDIATVITGRPSVRDFRITNEAILGALMDDNSQPLAFLESSVGFFTGGRIAPKQFPSGLGVQQGTEPLAIPDEPNGPLYSWQNFDEVTRNEFTQPAKEVTDIQQLARSLAEHPLDFTEHYFPTKMVTDLSHASLPEVGRDAVHTQGITANPTITFRAADAFSGGGIGGDPARGRLIVVQGYQHLDVLTAAATQNNSKAEPVSSKLAAFALS